MYLIYTGCQRVSLKVAIVQETFSFKALVDGGGELPLGDLLRNCVVKY